MMQTQQQNKEVGGGESKDMPESSGNTSSAKLIDSIKKALFVVGTFLVFFVAARNSIVWQVQNIWGASGNFWQKLWDDVYDLFGRNDMLIGTIGTFVLTFVVFWFWNAFLILLDTTGKPSFLMKYKIQEDANVPVDREKLMKAIKQVVFNQTVVGIPFTYAMMLLALKRNGGTFDAELPSFPWVLFEIFIFSLVEEIAFYYTHRIFHHPKLYRFIHKRHHEWTAPIGIIGLYSHPIEHACSNLLPAALGPLLMGSHLTTSWLWFALALCSTSISHSGYHFPGLPSPEAHDYHHLKFNQNYGVLGVLDRLHGTDNQFRASVAYKRHLMLLSWIPMSEQFPNQKKQKRN